MQMNNKKSPRKINILVGIVFVLLIGGLIFLSFEQTKIVKENTLLKILMRSNSELSKISIISQKADAHYNEASLSYANGDYKGTERESRLARNYYSDESQEYKRLKAELISSGIQDKLIDIYIQSLDTNIEIKDNMFEACEYFESASRYYDKYFSSNIESGFEMGTKEIEKMNERIRRHDSAVAKYNNLLAEFKVELEKRID